MRVSLRSLCILRQRSTVAAVAGASEILSYVSDGPSGPPKRDSTRQRARVRNRSLRNLLGYRSADVHSARARGLNTIRMGFFMAIDREIELRRKCRKSLIPIIFAE